MHKLVKKALSAVLAALLVMGASVTGLEPIESQAATSTSWNFKNSSFKKLGTISSTITVDNLTLVATKNSTMKVKSKKATVGDTSYTYALALGGKGDKNGRAVKVPVSGDDVIKVTLASSSSSSARTLILANEEGSQFATMNAGTSASTESCNYNGSGSYIWLYSQNSGIDIFKIQVDSKGTSDSSSKNDGSTGNSTAQLEKSADNTSSSSTLISDGWYYIKNINSQKYFDVAGNKDADGTNVIQYSGNGGNNQKWYVTNKGNNYITLKSGLSGGRVLDVADGSSKDGSNIQIYSANGSDAQTFQVVKGKTDGAYCLLTKCSGGSQAVDVYNWSTENNGNINTWSYNGYECQQFRFESTSYSGNSGSGSSNGTSDTSEDNGASDNSNKTQDSEPAQDQSSQQNTSDGKVVKSFKELVSAVASAKSSGGGKVYVSGTSISCDGQLALSASNANVQIIGVRNSDGTYPVLDFTPFMKSYIGKKSSDSAVGIRISGSKYTIKNLIIEHAPDNGIQIKGSSAGNNTVSNCIVRYNNDAGLQVTAGAYNNKVEYVCSYRNCDVYTRGGNADGFAPKLGAGKGNTFTYCYAWDNSDDGWDSFDKSGEETPDITYKYCAVWNNGNPNVFTGKYDFDNGNKLDEDLLLVQLIKAKDSSFASKYAKGSFALPSGSFIATDSGTISLSDWTGSKYDGNPNGFKLGSAKSTSRSTRTMSYCLAFDQAKKAFDNNNSALTASFDHCVAFDSGYNYYIAPFKITGWSNVVGFNGGSSDKLPSGYSVTKPSSSAQSNIRNTVKSTKNSIISNCQKNVIPGKVSFNVF